MFGQSLTKLSNKGLFILLEDCLVRAGDGNESLNRQYTKDQLNKAKILQKELSIRHLNRK